MLEKRSFVCVSCWRVFQTENSPSDVLHLAIAFFFFFFASLSRRGTYAPSPAQPGLKFITLMLNCFLNKSIFFLSRSPKLSAWQASLRLIVWLFDCLIVCFFFFCKKPFHESAAPQSQGWWCQCTFQLFYNGLQPQKYRKRQCFFILVCFLVCFFFSVIL